MSSFLLNNYICGFDWMSVIQFGHMETEANIHDSLKSVKSQAAF